MIQESKKLLLLVTIATIMLSCEKLEPELKEVLVYEETFDAEKDWKVAYNFLYSEFDPEPTVKQDSGVRTAGNNIREGQFWLGSYTDIDEYDHNWAYHDVDESQFEQRIKSATALIIELDIEDAQHGAASANYFELTLGEQTERWTLPDSSNFSLQLKLLNSEQSEVRVEQFQYMNFSEAMMYSSIIRFAFRSDLDGSWQNCQMRISGFKVYALLSDQS